MSAPCSATGTIHPTQLPPGANGVAPGAPIPTQSEGVNLRLALRADSAEKGLVVARYDYTATDMHELSMQRDERLRLLDDSQHWWCVMNSEGRVGYVPSNYVKRLKQGLFSSLRSTLRRKGRSKSTSSHDHTLTDSKAYTAFPGSHSLHRADVDAAILSSNNGLPKAGMVSHWPPYSAEQQTTSASQPHFLLGSPANQRPFVNGNIGQGHLSPPVGLSAFHEPRSGLSTSNFPNTSVSNSTNYYNLPFPAAAIMRLSPNEDENEFCVAKYPYHAAQMDELHLQTGQRLRVLEKSPDGWWRGISLASNQCGWFPSNYVILERRMRHYQQQQMTTAPQAQQHALHSTSPSIKMKEIPLSQATSFNQCSPVGPRYQAPVNGSVPCNPVVSLSPRILMQPMTSAGGGGVVSSKISQSDAVNCSKEMHFNHVISSKPPHMTTASTILSLAQIRSNEGQHVDMASKPWYWGTLSRLEAETVLRRQPVSSPSHSFSQQSEGAPSLDAIPLPPDRNPAVINSGRFLVRDCESEPGNLALTMCARDKVRNFRVQRRYDEASDSLKFHIGHKMFPSMEALITYYQHKPIHICDQEKFYLTQPVVKPS